MILNILRDIYNEFLFSKRVHSKRALDYLIDERHLTKKTIEYFKLGFARNYNAYHRLQKLGVSKETILESNMFYEDNRHNLCEIFNNVITIPIHYHGTTVHFTGRYIANDWVGYKLYAAHKHQTGRFQWAFNEDWDHDYKYVVIVESPIDCMTLWQHRINSIATFGANGISAPVANRLKDKVKKIFIAYDKDDNQAGTKGAERLARLFTQLRAFSNIVHWPEGPGKMDANTFFIDHNRQDFLDLLDESKTYKYTPTQRKNYISVPMDIEKIGIRYFKLNAINRGYLVPCPYHKDKKPSMHLFTDTNEFYCYGCGITGKPLQLLIHMEKESGHDLSVRDAIKLYKTF